MQGAIVGGSSAGCAVLLRRPIQGNRPWLPARPDASMPALNHRSRPSLGTTFFSSVGTPTGMSAVGQRRSSCREHLICNQVVGGSTPSVGTILGSSVGTPIGMPRYAYMDVGGRAASATPGTEEVEQCLERLPRTSRREHLICNQGVARPGTVEGRTMQEQLSRGSSVGCAFLLRRPIQGNHPWLPARPDAGIPALNHRSHPSPGTI